MLIKKKGRLTPSMEDYLEMIYRHCTTQGYTRINQLADELNVGAPSVTKIVQKLAKLGLLNYQRYGIVQLSEEGESIGSFLLERHMIIEKFLRNIGVNNTLTDTEMIEHNISADTLRNIHLLNKFFEEEPTILRKFNEFKDLTEMMEDYS